MPATHYPSDGARSMLQTTVVRVEQIVPRARILVIVGPTHVAHARAQLAGFGGITLLAQLGTTPDAADPEYAELGAHA